MFWLYTIEDVRVAGTERLRRPALNRLVILTGFHCRLSAQGWGLTAHFAQRWLLPSASPLSAVFDTRCGFPVRLDHEIFSVVA